MDDDNLYPTIEINGKEISRQEILPDELSSKIKGKTLEVYYYLAQHSGKHGVREIQRKLDYNSAALVSYHLNRLLDYDLIEKTPEGKYYIEGDPLKLGKLEDHVQIAGLLIPKILLFGYNSLASIIIAIILLLVDAPVRIWAGYVILSNIIFLGYILRESKKISEKLQVSQEES